MYCNLHRIQISHGGFPLRSEYRFSLFHNQRSHLREWTGKGAESATSFRKWNWFIRFFAYFSAFWKLEMPRDR